MSELHEQTRQVRLKTSLSPCLSASRVCSGLVLPQGKGRAAESCADQLGSMGPSTLPRCSGGGSEFAIAPACSGCSLRLLTKTGRGSCANTWCDAVCGDAVAAEITGEALHHALERRLACTDRLSSEKGQPRS